MSDLNTICLSGIIVEEPELKQDNKQNHLSEFHISCVIDDNEETNIFCIVAYNSVADLIRNEFEKDKPIVLQGYLRSRKGKIEVVAKQVYFAGKTQAELKRKNGKKDFNTPEVIAAKKQFNAARTPRKAD